MRIHQFVTSDAISVTRRYVSLKYGRILLCSAEVETYFKNSLPLDCSAARRIARAFGPIP
jgi:hypothetical protein